MKPLRVLELIASSRGGGATYVRDLALGLDPARFAIQVAMPEDGGNVSPADFESAKIPFHPIPIHSGFSLSSLTHIRALAAQTDILHVHGARAAFFGRLVALTLGSRRPRIIYSIHGFAAPHYPQPRRAILLGIERLLAPVTDRFLAVCHAERQLLRDHHIAPAHKTFTVWNRIDVAAFQPGAVNRAEQRQRLGVPQDALLITSVCRLFKPRDFDTLLRAFQAVAEATPQAHLLIVGDGPLRDNIAQLVHELNLSQRVTLAGWRKDLPAIYAASDIYTLTTWGWEGLPLTVLEAMASGLPVVATRAGGTPEAILENETGLLVERRDVAGLQSALLQLTLNQDQRLGFGEAARARVSAEFNLPQTIAEVAEHYTAVVA